MVIFLTILSLLSVSYVTNIQMEDEDHKVQFCVGLGVIWVLVIILSIIMGGD